MGRNVLSWWVRLGTGLRLEQQTEGQRCNNDRTTTTFMFVVAPRRHLCARRVSSVTAVAARRIINSDGVKDMTHEAKAKVKDLT